MFLAIQNIIWRFKPRNIILSLQIVYCLSMLLYPLFELFNYPLSHLDALKCLCVEIKFCSLSYLIGNKANT